MGVVDYVLLCVKLWDDESAGAEICPIVGPQTSVVPLQNGVDAADRLIPILGCEAVMGGMVGRMFQEFAVTVTVAIAVSVVVSLTLTPMMGARLLRDEHPEQAGKLSRALERGFDALLSGYDRMLVIALRHRFVTLMTMLATVAVTAWLFIVIPKGFFPEQDTGLILGVTEAAQDVSPDGMAALQQSVIAAVEKDPAVATVGAYIGAGGATSTENQGRVFIALKPRNQRPEIGQVMAQIDQETRGITGVRLFMQPVQDVNIGGRLTATQYQYTLTDVDLSELNKWGPVIESALAKLPQLADVTSDLQSAAPQLTLAINRDSASRLGITAAQIDAVLYDAFGQRPIAQLYTSLNQYFVIMEVKPGFQLGPNALQRIYVRSQTSGMVPLSELVTQHTTVSPLSVNHQGQFPSVTISFNLKGNAPLGPAVSAIQHQMATLHVPPTISASFQGNAQAFQSSLSSTPILILAALVAVYIILGTLYENLIHPLTIISTLPAAGAGALVVLLVCGFGLDVMGIIGIILLIGIVKKNGIMLVDFALDAERSRGLTAEQSIHEACLLRFRPILDDHDVRPAWQPATDAGHRHRVRAAPAARLRDGGRPGGFPGPDAVHHAGGLHLHGQACPPALVAQRRGAPACGRPRRMNRVRGGA